MNYLETNYLEKKDLKKKYYLSLKAGDPFISYFSGQSEVKTLVIHNLGDKVLARQISKLFQTNTEEANIVFSPDLTNYLLNTPNLFDHLSNILETEYSIAIDITYDYENISTYLHIYAAKI